MPHGLPHTTPGSLDQIFETLDLLKGRFDDPTAGVQAERFARGQERQSADLARLFEQSQQQPKRGFIDKITPILEAVAFIADRTSSDRRRRGEALPKFQAIKGAREERLERKRQRRRQEFADQANILGLVGEGKRAAFDIRRGGRQTKAQRERDLFGLAVKAQPKPVKGATISAADKRKNDAREAYTAFLSFVPTRPDGNFNWEATDPQLRLAISNAAKTAGLVDPVPDVDAAAIADRKEAIKRAERFRKDNGLIEADPRAEREQVEATADAFQGLQDPSVDTGLGSITDFLDPGGGVTDLSGFQDLFGTQAAPESFDLSEFLTNIGLQRPEAERKASGERVGEFFRSLFRQTGETPLPRLPGVGSQPAGQL